MERVIGGSNSLNSAEARFPTAKLMLVIFLLFYLKIDNYPLIGILNLQIHAAESNMEAYRIQDYMVNLEKSLTI